MSEDKREAILLRLVEIAQTLVDPNNVFRNQIDVPENMRPAIVILDADEADVFGRERPLKAPYILDMEPEIFFLLEGKPDTSAKPGELKVGSELNKLRARTIKTVLEDASLIALSHEGDIRYGGFATGFAAGRSMEGEAGISFTIRYVMRPSKL